MPDSSSSRLSYSSSASSTPSSVLSTSHVLSSTDRAALAYPRKSTASSSNQRQGHESDDEPYSSRCHSRQEESTRQLEEPESALPSITYFPPEPLDSTPSVNTYDPRFSENNLGRDSEEGHGDESFAYEPEPIRLQGPDDAAIPSVLPLYRAGPTDPTLKPSDHRTFGYLFPSMNRLSIRHDDTTSDGNMNLRVETVVAPGSLIGVCQGSVLGSHGRPVTMQLFHLRMYDLVNREFSFRRHSRDSGREVCSSKRAFTKSTGISRGTIHHSVSSALRSVKAPFRRSNASNLSSFSLKTSSGSRRPSTAGTMAARSSASIGDGSDILDNSSSHLAVKPPSEFLVPTDSIKLEFNNYARVEVSRRSSGRYDFEWWGHKYTWKRAVDKMLNTFSFHLVRDDQEEPVAHIAQEIRSPSQIDDEERAGGWIPPCYMWISDQSTIDAVTDVAEPQLNFPSAIVSTGLITLVDYCIRQCWQSKKATSGSAPLRPGEPHLGTDAEDIHPSPSRGLFSRRRQKSSKAFRLGKQIAVY
ncbi:uncharacterized protein MAM_02646 [Metarhizium album ARSEF 1941]|uniref:Uncharacterized protein n=1 Tax=Metarhizium album (strain ARSEF 1941) TaxID=1081103 RepID=A0A0B2X0I7_METAS|nr:uncharacterized protein MAM_02646 [Metarhizium album ARSEF 1941]KHN99793.1 hypothetical protein MAM_02646 [Metarhizium album ARSEF 1941]